MTREELEKLNDWIMELSEEEKQDRDRYIMQLAKGELQGPPVEYASISKPWFKDYDEEKFTTDFPKELFYTGLLRQNEKNMRRKAFNYFFSNILYRRFFVETNKLIKALHYSGVKEGESVGVCLASIPESMYSLAACSYLGTIGLFFPPYLDEKSMISDINKNNTRVLLVMDLFYEKYSSVFDRLINNSKIEKVVIVPTLNSSVLRYLKRTKKELGPQFMYYNEFIEESKNKEMPPIVKYSSNKPLAVVYSSGTTGILKGVLLSNEAFVNSAASYTAFGFDLTPGQIVYQVIPDWTSTGLIADGSTPLYYGCKLYQNPTFDPIVYSKNLGIHRINWGIATTELFCGLLKLRESRLFRLLVKLGIINYRNLKNAYIGGTISTKNDVDALNEMLEELGAPARIRRSYGTCENGSIVTAELNNREYPERSVGIPIPGVNLMCIDENEKEVPIGERGEIAVCTKCGMINYYNRPDLANIFFFDGKNIFKHTGDMGRITKDGVLIYEGRLNDYSIIGGNKVFNFDVKNVILEKENIYDCEVFTNDYGQFCVHIIFRCMVDDMEAEIHDIQQMIFDSFQSDVYVPNFFKIRSSFPMAGSTKRDYKALKSENDGLIYQSFEKGRQLIRK